MPTSGIIWRVLPVRRVVSPAVITPNKSRRVIHLLLQRAATQEKTAPEILSLSGGKPANAYLDTPRKEKSLHKTLFLQ